MTDQIEILKPKPKARQPRQGWTDSKVEIIQENVISPIESSNDGDRSPAYSEPVGVFSPSTPNEALSPTIDVQHSKSFDSASISSKRTSVSAEMSSLIRQRVRQQARSFVDKKRGSVQLAKRLLRSHALQSAELPFSLDDFEATEKQLEKSLQLGAKYVTKESSAEAPDYIQHRFFQATPIETQEISRPLVVFSKPKSTVKQRSDFSALLTVYRQMTQNTIEDPAFRLDPKIFRTQGGRDFRLILARHGNRFASNTHGIKGLEPMITKKIERTVREEDEDFALVEYRYPENWFDSTEYGGGLAKKYFQFNIDLNHLEFEHHWLFGQEDVIGRKLRNMHSMYVGMCEQLVKLLKEYADLKQRMDIEIIGEDEQTRINNKLVEIKEQISQTKEEIPKLATLLETTYDVFKQIKQSSGINSPNYRLEKFAGTPIEDDFGQEFSFATYLLKHVYVKTQADPSKSPSRVVRTLSQLKTAHEQIQILDQERRAAINKCRIRVKIYFNDILVCKTDEVALNWDFTANFSQVYNLKVYEQPETVLLIVSEKFDRNTWRDLAKIYVPFVSGNDAEIQPLEPMEFASQIAISSFKTSIGCGEMPRSPYLSGRLFCNAVWIEGGIGSALYKIRESNTTTYQNSFSLIPSETLLGPENQSDARIEALYRRYHTRHSDKEKSHRIGMHSNEVEHSFLDSQTNDFNSGAELTMDVFRDMGRQYAISIRNHLMETATFKRRTKSYHDIVREDSIPVLFNFVGTLCRAPDMSRKLKPTRNQQRAKTFLHSRHKIVINIQSATNLPEKLNGEPTNIFVDVIFRKQRAQTAAVEGRYANWQETIVLEIERENNFNNSDISHLNDYFEFRLYDRILTTLDYDNRETNTIHEQVENRFLGQAVIPFSTVYSLGKIDGVTSIQKPLFHTDYKFIMEKPSQLKILITSDPPLLPPQLHLNDFYGFMGGENAQIISECMQWQRKCNEKFPERIYYALVNDTTGKSVLTINYVQPIPAPHIIKEVAVVNALKGCQLAAHVVSCIPLVVHPIVCSYSSNVWMTIDQILTIGCATAEEHAVLLASWLLGLDYTTAVLLGRSLPEGTNAAYVLVEVENNPTYLINPCNGNRYQLDDTTCPLFQICTVITSDNVYGNLQSVAHPCQMEFNFSRRQHWEPLFNDKRNNFVSAHKATIVYTDVPEDIVMELRTNLERQIRIKFDQNRPFGIPQWNVLALRALREVLNELGVEPFEPKQVDVRNKFNQLGIHYEFSALAFQRGYSSRDQLVNDVLNTQVHVNANPLAQFAFAVHIQPYFNNIVSCSLAIACLQPSS